MKFCSDCGEKKPLKDFYRHPKTIDGRMGICKDCHKAAMKLNRRNNPEVQRRDNERAKLPHRRIKGRKDVVRWRSKHPDRYAAQTTINNAIRDGKIGRHRQCACGARKNVFGVATNLEHPLRKIIWRCAKCHHRARFAA